MSDTITTTAVTERISVGDKLVISGLDPLPEWVYRMPRWFIRAMSRLYTRMGWIVPPETFTVTSVTSHMEAE